MKKEFIPYEQALDLKKLRFDEECICTYSSDTNLSRNPSHDMENLPIEGQPYLWRNSKIHSTCVTAPLYQQAFRWFREKCKLHYIICKNMNIDGYGYREVTQIAYMKEDKNNIFKTYEEAELECLKKLIEIIKINKNGKINLYKPKKLQFNVK